MRSVRRSTTTRFVLPVLALAALLAACGTTKSPAPSGPSGPSGTTTTTLGTVGTSGGTLASAAGGVVLGVPAGAVSTSVTVTSAPPSHPPKGGIAPVVTLGPLGTLFQKDATLTLHYDPATLPSGTKPSQLVVVREAKGAWAVLPTRLDTAKHTASAPVGGLGTFALVSTAATFVGPSIEQVRLLQAGAYASGSTDALPGFRASDPTTPFSNGWVGGCSNRLQGIGLFPATAGASYLSKGAAGSIPLQAGQVDQASADDTVKLAMSSDEISADLAANAHTRPLQLNRYAVAYAGAAYDGGNDRVGAFFTVANPTGEAVQVVVSWAAGGSYANGGGGSEVIVDAYAYTGSCSLAAGSGALFQSTTPTWTDKGSHTFTFPALAQGSGRTLYVYLWLAASAHADTSTASSATNVPDDANAGTQVDVTVEPVMTIDWAAN